MFVVMVGQAGLVGFVSFLSMVAAFFAWPNYNGGNAR
jgi:hypothetical protein